MGNDTPMMAVICQCGHQMKVPAAAMGKTCKCVKCAERFMLTAQNTRPLSVSVPLASPGLQTNPIPKPQASPDAPDRRVGQLLIANGLITEKQLEEALAMQAQRGGRLFEVLIQMDSLGKKELHSFLSKQSGVASIDLKHYEIPHELISIVPREFAQRNVVLPIDKMGKLLTVGMACPLDTATIVELERITGLKVKAMLCAFDDIHATIDRYYPSETQAVFTVKTPGAPKPPAPKPAAAKEPVLRKEEVLAAIDRLDMLPMFAGTKEQVQRAAASDQALRDVAGVVCADPALAAKLLSVSNMPAYGMTGRVANVNLAVALLGADGALTIVQSLDGVSSIDPVSRFDMNRYWLQSMFCAAAAMSIAKASNRGAVGDAYTAGLLHDIGRLALAAMFPASYARAPEYAGGTDWLQAEEMVFGMTHAEAGHAVARAWRLPQPVADAIRYHHEAHRATDSRDLVAIASLASVMTEAFENDALPADAFKESKGLLSYLVVDEAEATRIYDRTAAALRSTAESRA